MSAIRVLVIDDNASHAAGLVAQLNTAGFESCFAITGNDGIKSARQEHVDAVLVDMNLRDMSGRNVCQALRLAPSTSHTAVIMHSGAGPIDDLIDEADAFLIYPMVVGELHAVVRGCVARRRSKSEVCHNEIPGTASQVHAAQHIF
jgi:DNA-binding response OmpR family regulator